MIPLFIVAAITALVTFGLSLLPGSTFMAIPSAATAAITTVGGVGGWMLGLGGTAVKSTLLVLLPLVVTIKVFSFGWQILRKWRPPGMARTL